MNITEYGRIPLSNDPISLCLRSAFLVKNGELKKIDIQLSKMVQEWFKRRNRFNFGFIPSDEQIRTRINSELEELRLDIISKGWPNYRKDVAKSFSNNFKTMVIILNFLGTRTLNYNPELASLLKPPIRKLSPTLPKTWAEREQKEPIEDIQLCFSKTYKEPNDTLENGET